MFGHVRGLSCRFGGLFLRQRLADVACILFQLRLLLREVVTLHGLLAHHFGKRDAGIAQLVVGVADFLIENAGCVGIHGSLTGFVGSAAQRGP